MTSDEKQQLIERYERGPALLRETLARVPKAALQWRPAPGKWSVHEVVCHCADSETIASARIRYLIGEDHPTIQGYDENRWAQRLDYHAVPLELALRQVEQVRAWTVELLRRLPDSAWERTATHTESGAYSGAKWLAIYAEHLEVHSRQIERNLAAWNAGAAR